MLNTNKISIAVASILGAALIVSSLIVSRTVLKIKGYNQTITVTGAAYQPIKSDFAVWEGIISTSSADLEQAYATVKKHLGFVTQFLAQQGYRENEYTLGTVELSRSYNRERILTGYTLKQKVKVESTDVDRITRLAKDASSLIEKGVEFESRPPRYLFTKLDAMKLEMIERATSNARFRAERLAESTGRNVGVPRSARIGVFQIRPLHSQQVSDYGVNDVTSIDKEIASTVHVSFSFE
ncbi:MAG: SIMPL domain-containing protein [Candidatus Zixiibacteriota bacterium]|nr:MAG: SIMPL domain-containing protein [candidate division Zixibacteria bacterium]